MSAPHPSGRCNNRVSRLAHSTNVPTALLPPTPHSTGMNQIVLLSQSRSVVGRPSGRSRRQYSASPQPLRPLGRKRERRRPDYRQFKFRFWNLDRRPSRHRRSNVVPTYGDFVARSISFGFLPFRAGCVGLGHSSRINRVTSKDLFTEDVRPRRLSLCKIWEQVCVERSTPTL